MFRQLLGTLTIISAAMAATADRPVRAAGPALDFQCNYGGGRQARTVIGSLRETIVEVRRHNGSAEIVLNLPGFARSITRDTWLWIATRECELLKLTDGSRSPTSSDHEAADCLAWKQLQTLKVHPKAKYLIVDEINAIAKKDPFAKDRLLGSPRHMNLDRC